jgi:hypothetical protein
MGYKLEAASPSCLRVTTPKSPLFLRKFSTLATLKKSAAICVNQRQIFFCFFFLVRILVVALPGRVSEIFDFGCGYVALCSLCIRFPSQ